MRLLGIPFLTATLTQLYCSKNISNTQKKINQPVKTAKTAFLHLFHKKQLFYNFFISNYSLTRRKPPFWAVFNFLTKSILNHISI